LWWLWPPAAPARSRLHFVPLEAAVRAIPSPGVEVGALRWRAETTVTFIDAYMIYCLALLAGPLRGHVRFITSMELVAKGRREHNRTG